MARQRYSGQGYRGYSRVNKKMEKMVATLVIAVAVFVLNQMGIDIGGSGSKVKPLKEKSVEQLLDEVRVASPDEYADYDRNSYTEPYKKIEYKGRK